jgi:hypothetical protein
LKYHDELEEYYANITVSKGRPIPIPQTSSRILLQEPEEESESDKEENFVGDLIIEGIQSKYNKNNKYCYDMNKKLELLEQKVRKSYLVYLLNSKIKLMS